MSKQNNFPPLTRGLRNGSHTAVIDSLPGPDTIETSDSVLGLSCAETDTFLHQLSFPTHSTDTAHNTIDGPFLVSLSNNKLTKKLVRQVRAVVVEKPDYFTNWVVKLS